MPQVVHVAVGIILNNEDQVLIAFRDPQKHQGGLWEFPGGKVEADESVEDALKRELAEELDLISFDMKAMLQIEHDYGDKQVFLDIWEVLKFEGEAMGREGQEIRWVSLQDLRSYQFPAANQPIVDFLQKRMS